MSVKHRAARAAARATARRRAGRIDLGNPQTESGNDDFGEEVAGAGDVNGDGRVDFLVGAPVPHAFPIMVHFYFGVAPPDAATWNGAGPAGRVDLINPNQFGDEFGTSLSGAH